MEANPIAQVTFFSKSVCGYCKQFKGETTDSSGVVKIDPNSGWETLTSDLELQNMGVVFNIYQFGPEKDPRTGKVKNYVLTEPYTAPGRIRGVPHLELTIPGDPNQYSAFDPAGLTGWEASKSVPVIKKWIIQTLQTEPFKSYAAAIRSGKPPKPRQVASPAQVQQPAQKQAPQRPAPTVDATSSQRIAQVQAQQRHYHQNQAASGQEHGIHHHHVHAPHPHQHVERDEEHEVVEQPRRQVRQAPTTFGMGTKEIRPVVTPSTVPVSPARQSVQPAKTVEKPRTRFVPANADE